MWAWQQRTFNAPLQSSWDALAYLLLVLPAVSISLPAGGGAPVANNAAGSAG